MSLESVEKLMQDTSDAIAYQEVCHRRPIIPDLLQEVSNLLASRVTNEEEEEVLEEFEQLHREALGLPEVPVHRLPTEEPQVEDVRVEEQPTEERQAVFA
jgi:charged multivesicular body protein 6